MTTTEAAAATTGTYASPLAEPRTLAEDLLAPRSVAIIGASDDLAKTTSRPLRFLRQAGFAGRVYPINPRRPEVLGEKAWPSLESLPEVPDHVLVLTGTDHAIEAVRECGRAGVRLATILASGFGEGGAEGQAKQQELVDAATEGGVRLVGPSSLGVANPRNGMLLTANAAFDEDALPPGEVFVASQSGSVIGALLSRGIARGMGFAGLVSVGGEADLSIGEICRATLDDPGITSYALFLESLQHTEDLAEFAHAAHAAGKPVAVYKLGRSEEAASLSVSHTGALAGEDSEADAFLAACGFARVDHFEALVEAPQLLRRLGAREDATRAPRVGVITTTGGGAALVVDQLATRGVSVVPASAASLQKMTDAGCPVAPNLIVDLTLAGAKHELVRAAVSTMQDSGEYDLVIFVIGSSARSNPELAVKAIAECADGATPIAAFALPDAPATLELLASAGVPAFRTPESCADAVAAALARQAPSVLTERPHPSPDDARVLDEVASAELLRDQGVGTVPGVVVDLADVDAALPLPFDYPVVVKVLSDRIPHKTDAGGVILHVQDGADLRAAISQVVAAVGRSRPDVTLTRVLVQQMATPGVADALVGYRVSPAVGPTVLLAAGGVFTELYADSTMRLAPVDEPTARAMVSEVKGLRLLAGFRGGPAGDVEALVATVVAVSRLAVDHPEVVEAEVNPLSIRREGEGVLALDALVRTADRANVQGVTDAGTSYDATHQDPTQNPTSDHDGRSAR